ncbi:MAG TPA: hypothetical protein ENO22_01590 [candidate division Zixibacteria bacterium]|nr:hypothetical protein [candidate division Zixibacteria bacterium]HEQ98014.1 hypothetical protein [candidate division Zixibacteria bacterium]
MELEKSYKYCLSLNHLGMEYPLLAASLLPEDKKNSIAATLASFRVIIDKIHSSLGSSSLDRLNKDEIRGMIEEWNSMVRDARQGKCRDHEVCLALADSFNKFNIPTHPWEDFSNALNFHLDNVSVADEKTFQDYCRWTYGAGVYNYIHILASQNNGPGYTLNFKPEFLSDDLAALFFITHTLTDIAHDLTSTRDGFIFIPRTVLERHGISRGDIMNYYRRGEIDNRFRKMIDEYYHLGREYELFVREKLVLIRGEIQKEDWFILDLLLNIYSNFLHRIWEYPEAIFRGGFPIDPAMVFINAMKLQKDLGLNFRRDLSRLLSQSVA